MSVYIPTIESYFRQALSCFASGVTVVTTAQNGQLYGMTVTSFTSLSLRPPLVLVCVDQLASTHQAICLARRFAVNILEKGQESISRRFATHDKDKFGGVAWHMGQMEVPVLEGALAVIECRLYDHLSGGDHAILVGEVLNTQVYEGTPLLYCQRQYYELR